MDVMSSDARPEVIAHVAAFRDELSQKQSELLEVEKQIENLRNEASRRYHEEELFQQHIPHLEEASRLIRILKQKEAIIEEVEKELRAAELQLQQNREMAQRCQVDAENHATAPRGILKKNVATEVKRPLQQRVINIEEQQKAKREYEQLLSIFVPAFQQNQ